MFCVFKNIYCILQTVYLQKRSTVLLEITEEAVENDTMPAKASLCAFALACTSGVSNLLLRCVS